MRKSRFSDERMVAILREADRDQVGAVAKRRATPVRRTRQPPCSRAVSCPVPLEPGTSRATPTRPKTTRTPSRPTPRALYLMVPGRRLSVSGEVFVAAALGGLPDIAETAAARLEAKLIDAYFRVLRFLGRDGGEETALRVVPISAFAERGLEA